MLLSYSGSILRNIVSLRLERPENMGKVSVRRVLHVLGVPILRSTILRLPILRQQVLITGFMGMCNELSLKASLRKVVFEGFS